MKLAFWPVKMKLPTYCKWLVASFALLVLLIVGYSVLKPEAPPPLARPPVASRVKIPPQQTAAAQKIAAIAPDASQTAVRQVNPAEQTGTNGAPANQPSGQVAAASQAGQAVVALPGGQDSPAPGRSQELAAAVVQTAAASERKESAAVEGKSLPALNPPPGDPGQPISGLAKTATDESPSPPSSSKGGAAAAQQTSSPPPRAAAPDPEVKAARTIAGSGFFTVQVGAFRKKGNADNLCLLLQKRGYKPKVSIANGGNGPLYLVQIGKFLRREAAVEAGENLKGKENLPAVVAHLGSL